MPQLNKTAVFCVFSSAVLLFKCLPQDSTTAEDVTLPHIYTYIDSPVAEQRQVYTRADIEKLHVISLTELFNAAGIQTLDYGAYGSQSNPSIRGFTGGTVKVVIDGVTVNSAQNGNFDFTSVKPSDIEKIEITRGGFTETLSGEGAVGGVIYITTKRQTLGNIFSAGVSGKSYFNKNCPIDTVASNFSWNGQPGENTFIKLNMNGTYAANKFLYHNYLGKIREYENAEVKDANNDIKLSHFFGNGNSWTAGDLFYCGYKNIPNGDGIQQDYNNKACFTVDFPAIKEMLSINSSAKWISNNQKYDDTDEKSVHNLNSAGFQAEGYLYKYRGIKETVGFNIEINHLESTNTGTHTIAAGTIKQTTNFFFNTIFSCTVPLSFTFSNKNCAVLPKIGFCADFSAVKILLDGYRMVSFPTMNQLYWQGTGASGNENLDKEDGWGAELTCNSNNFFLPVSLSLYTNYYENSIHWGYGNGKTTPLNIKSAFYLGCDISAEKTIFQILKIRGNFEYLYNRLLDKNDESTYGKMIMWTPDIVASGNVQLTLKYMHFLVEANYIGKRYEDNTNIYELDPYLLINTAVDVTVWNKINPYIRIDNILNTKYTAIPDYPMPGISIEIGMQAKW